MDQVVGASQAGHGGWRQADVNGDVGVVQYSVDHPNQVADGRLVQFDPTVGTKWWWPVDV
jgi:hypothetical protein